MMDIGVSPVRSGEILDCAINCLRQREVLSPPLYESCRRDADALKELLPEHYLPDVYLDLPLTDGSYRGMAVVLDSFDRNYLDFTSGGDYFRARGMDALCAPEHRDDLLIIPVKNSSYGSFLLSKKLPELTEADGWPDKLPGSGRLTGLGLKYRKEPLPDGFCLTITTGRQDAAKRFPQREYRDALLALLRKAGCDEAAIELLEAACLNLGVPYFHREDGYREWVTCMDVAALSIIVWDFLPYDCHAIIRISDKSMNYSYQAIKPVQAYQWHITDNCDQRCRHCYLFAEDAGLHCETTPWDQLILTLDEITSDAKRRYTLPMPVISGGDPLLHPDFWRFAGELHKRGLRWAILGNPFHLTADSCERLYSLGCIQYQLSLDGREKFHDSLRKPGSFNATLAAVKLLSDAGISTQFMATVSRLNMEEVLSCMDIAADSGVDDFAFARYCATTPQKASLYPSPAEYRDFLLRYHQKALEYKEKGCHTRFRYKEHLFMLLWYELGEFEPSEYSKHHPEMIFEGCHLGMGCSILPNGDLMACRRMESVIGNVRTSRISDILTGELCKSYADISKIKKCRDCELLQWCRGCRAVGFNATGDICSEDPCCWKKKV